MCNTLPVDMIFSLQQDSYVLMQSVLIMIVVLIWNTKFVLLFQEIGNCGLAGTGWERLCNEEKNHLCLYQGKLY